MVGIDISVELGRNTLENKMTTLTFSFRHLSSLLLLGAGLQQLHGVFGRPRQLQGPDGEVRQGLALHEGPAARGNGSSRRRHHQSRPDH